MNDLESRKAAMLQLIYILLGLIFLAACALTYVLPFKVAMGFGIAGLLAMGAVAAYISTGTNSRNE